MSARITVDRLRCDGRGVCAELLPEVITLDDWGYPIVAAAIVPDHLLAQARGAVAGCPVLALRLDAQRRKDPVLTGDSQHRVTVL
jgi:ferredoxin